MRNGKIRFFLSWNTYFPRFLLSLIRSLSASTEVVYRPRSQSPLHFDIGNIEQICTQNSFPIASRTTSASSRSALTDRSDLPVMLITRLSKADKKNWRGRSPSICRTQWPAGIEIRHWNILGDSIEILKGIFEKQEQFSKRIVFAKFDW